MKTKITKQFEKRTAPPKTDIAQNLNHLQALWVESIALVGRNEFEDFFFLLNSFGGLEFVESGQIEDDAVLKSRLRMRVDEPFQHAQSLPEATQIDQAHGDVVLGLLFGDMKNGSK